MLTLACECVQPHAFNIQLKSYGRLSENGMLNFLSISEMFAF